MIASALLAALAGLAFGLSLIIVIGPQNAYLLKVGMQRRHVGAVVAVCTVSDIALIVAGTAGAGATLQSAHWALTLVRYGGAAFLLVYAVIALRRAATPGHLHASSTPTASRVTSVVGAALALTWLNPAVYLDTVVLLGTVANSHAPRQWFFALGAAAASTAWFCGIGFGARRLGPRLDRPTTWRVLDVLVAVIMTAAAVRLLLS